MAVDLQSAAAAIRAEEAVARAFHEREARRASGVCMSGMGPGPFVGLSEAQVAEEARRRVAAIDSPDAVLKRALLAAWKAGSLDAAEIVKAADRGSPGWQARARDLLGPSAAQSRAA